MKVLIALLYVHEMFSCSLNAVGNTSRGEIKTQPCPEARSVVVMADLVYFKHLK